MNEIQKRAIDLIEAQQKKFGAYSPVRMAGEQLKGIVLAEPDAAELLEQDLQKKGMGLEAAEKKIRALADSIHKTEKGSCVAVPPWEAEDVLRKFYGLRERTWGPGKDHPETGDGGTDCHASASAPAGRGPAADGAGGVPGTGNPSPTQAQAMPLGGFLRPPRNDNTGEGFGGRSGTPAPAGGKVIDLADFF